MRIAMVSEHADPTAAPGGEDAGGQNVHVAALARALAARDHTITVYTRLASPGAEPVVPLTPGVEVHRLAAGPAAPPAHAQNQPPKAEIGAPPGPGGARRRRCPRTGCCRTWLNSAPRWAGNGPGSPRTWSTPTSGCPG